MHLDLGVSHEEHNRNGPTAGEVGSVPCEIASRSVRDGAVGKVPKQGATLEKSLLLSYSYSCHLSLQVDFPFKITFYNGTLQIQVCVGGVRRWGWGRECCHYEHIALIIFYTFHFFEVIFSYWCSKYSTFVQYSLLDTCVVLCWQRQSKKKRRGYNMQYLANFFGVNSPSGADLF